MRSRYTAFAVGNEDYLFRTWHPRTRPQPPYFDPAISWCGLTIVEVVDGVGDCPTGIVEFVASYQFRDEAGALHQADGRGSSQRPHAGARSKERTPHRHQLRSGQIRERSLFTRRGGRWVYVEAIS